MINTEELDLFNDLLDAYLPDTGYDGILPTSKAYRNNGLDSYCKYLVNKFKGEQS